MAATQLSKVVRYIHEVTVQQAVEEASDADLLRRFVLAREESAFEALVRRHGALVLGVCRRVLKNQADAEDCFQATFLVLARKAGSIHRPASLGSWLYGVAYRVARKAKATRARRRAKEAKVVPRTEADNASADLSELLDQELSALPEKQRAVVVLCDLEGKTHKQAAAELGCAAGTVASRLARARAQLARRLSRRGLALPVGGIVGLLSREAASACVSAPLIKAATLHGAGKAAASAQVLALTQEVLKAMLLSKLKIAALVLLAAALTGLVSVPGSPQSGPTPAASAGEQIRDQEDLRQTLLALEKRLWKASATQDADALGRLLADDFVSFSRLGRYNKQDSVEAIRRQRVADFEAANLEVIRLNKDAALVSYVGSWKVFTKEGVEHCTNRRVTDCWARRQGVWVLVCAQETTVSKDVSGIRFLESQFSVKPGAGRLFYVPVVQEDAVRLQGTWKVESFKAGAKLLPEWQGRKLVLQGDRVTVHPPKGEPKEAVFRLEPGMAGRVLSFRTEREMKEPGADGEQYRYELRGDRLTLRLIDKGQPPQQPGSDGIVIELKRLPDGSRPAGRERKEPEPECFSVSRDFRIPITLDPSRRRSVSDLSLYVSTDKGKTWREAQRTTPDSDSLTFHAPADGLYWFAVRVRNRDGTAEPPELLDLRPVLRVRVSTTADVGSP